MQHFQPLDIPFSYSELSKESDEIGFTMPSDLKIGTLLKSLVASRPSGQFLELGTGIGLSLSWMVEGMDTGSNIISLDNDNALVELVNSYFEEDPRVQIQCVDAGGWLENNTIKFDLIFADAWPGKYSHLNEALKSLKTGGFYVIDDMKEQTNWPEGQDKKAAQLIEQLELRNDITLTKLDWSTGVLMAVKK